MSQINVDNIKNRLGSGAPSFPNGIDVSSGVTTFTNGLNVGTGASVFSPGTNELALGTNSAERVRVGAAGSVGIGTDNPGASLDVVSNSSAEIARLRGRSADNIGTLYFQNNAGSTNYAYIQSRSTYLDIATETTNPIIFTTNQSERMRLLSGGGLTFNGDTAAANALDDYEEGTFTPNVAGTATYTYQEGIYTKIGNQVFCNCRIRINSIGSGFNTYFIGLPFTPAQGTILNAAAAAAYYENSSTSLTWVGGQVNTTIDKVLIVGQTSASSNIVNGVNFFGNNTDLILSFNYKTNA